MKNLFQLPSSNEFEKRSEEFFDTQLFRRLQEKYEPKPYEKRFGAVRKISLIGSYFCNAFSILTASTYVFSFFFSVFLELPYPALWSSILTGFVLVLIESLQRILAPLLFKNTLQFGFKSSYLTILAAIASLSAFSVFFSYNGGFDVVSTLSSPPLYQEPELYSIEQTKSEYREMIADAGKDAENYKQSKLWNGRLSDKHAAVYQNLLDKKAELKAELSAKVNEYEELNRQLLFDANSNHQSEISTYENSVQHKGSGLAIFAVIIQVLFFLSIFYMEYFDFRTATQYATLIQGKANQKGNTRPPTPSKQVNGFPLDGKFNGEKPPRVRNQIGFVFGQHKQNESQLEQGASPKTKTVFVEDKKTVLHNGKYYTLQGVNNFVNIYRKRHQAAIKNGKPKLAESRGSRLQYWLGKQKELLES